MSSSSQQRQRLSKSKRREIRLRRDAKARRACRQLHENVALLPDSLRSFFTLFAPSFTKPTLLRFTLLAVAAILTVGPSTVCNLLRTLGRLAPGDPSSYHRVFSSRRWSLRSLSRALAGWIFDHLVADGPILLAADDTVSEHPGDKVHGKSCHRDAVRSSHSFTAFRWGHKWLVVAVLVHFPWTCRYWALPLFVALCRSKKDDEKAKRRHRTPAESLKLILFVLRRWFPDRTFLLAADGGFATHDLAGFATRQKQKLSLVSRFYKNASLYELPPVPVLKANGKKPNGRPRVKGAKLDTPEEAVAKAKERTKLRVTWYGGGVRDVEVMTATGHWYKSGEGLVLVRWVLVRDQTEKPRDEYFFTTDVNMTAQEVIETYAKRWNLETTFQEMRSQIGLETTRGWKKETVLRAEPCLFGLYSVVVCLFSMLPEAGEKKGGVDWQGKENVTFSDAMRAVRKWLWRTWVFQACGQREAFEKLAPEFQELILNGLAPAA